MRGNVEALGLIDLFDGTYKEEMKNEKGMDHSINCGRVVFSCM